jgi:hypothetical protein
MKHFQRPMKEIVLGGKPCIVDELFVPLGLNREVAAHEVEKALPRWRFLDNDSQVVGGCDVEKVEEEVSPVHVRKDLLVVPALTLAGCC